MQHGQQRQQERARVRLGYEGEGKPDTKLYRALETRRKSSTKYVKEVEGKLSMFESKGLCGDICRGWKCLWGMERTGRSTGGCSGDRAVSFSVQKAARWLLLRFAPFLSPAQACSYRGKQPGWTPPPGHGAERWQG